MLVRIVINNTSFLSAASTLLFDHLHNLHITLGLLGLCNDFTAFSFWKLFNQGQACIIEMTSGLESELVSNHGAITVAFGILLAPLRCQSPHLRNEKCRLRTYKECVGFTDGWVFNPFFHSCVQRLVSVCQAVG